MKIIGQSTKIQEVLRTADLVANTDVPVLITGGIGSGKQLFAQRIHQQSTRKQQAFIKVNCASFDEASIEACLFGSESIGNNPAIEGAIKKARSGTLFLNEVSALSPSAQAKLRHFIDTREVILGQNTIKKYDVRLIVSSKTNLYKHVKKGSFRNDLFYQLNVIPIELPALETREGDVPLLMDYFFRQLVHEQHQTPPNFTKAALKQITRYNWPGNVRELENFCERMYVLFSGKTVEATNLPHELRHYTQNKTSPFSLPASGIQLEQLEVDFIQQALQVAGGNKSKAARLLGLTRDTFLYRIKKYSIKT